MVLRQCKVDILQTQNLAGCYHSKCHTRAIQFCTWLKLNKVIFINLTSNIIIMTHYMCNCTSDETEEGLDVCPVLEVRTA